MNRIIKLIISSIISIIISIPITLMIQFNGFYFAMIFNINIFLFLLSTLFIFYLLSHFIFKIEDIYTFIYNKRYLIATIILLIIVLGKFNGSSIGMWNDNIEPNNRIGEPIIGTNRYIRSDEWLVNTPYAISQQFNNYKYFSSLPRSEKTDMFSTIFVPIKDILIITRPFNIGYLLLGEEYGLSFYWYGRLIVLLLVSFEFMMFLTDKNKLLSFAGSILLTGSPLVSWFYSNYIVDLLISGQLCLLLFNKFLETKENKYKILYSILLAFAFSWFAFTLYPAWQVPLGYMYLVFAIYIFIKNKKNNSLKDYSYLIITVLLFILLLTRYLLLSKETLNIIMSTVYPGERIFTGGGNKIINFIYPISIFFPIADYKNPCEVSGIYSLFPIPIVISIIYLIKTKLKKDNNYDILILLLTILVIILTLLSIIPIPKLIAKITLISMTTSERIAPIIGIICLYLLLLTVNKIKIKNNKNKIIVLFFTIVVSYLIIKIAALDKIWYLTNKKLYISLVILSITIYLYINSNSKSNEKLLSIIFIILGGLNIILVNPVTIGTEVMHGKETAKKIQELVKKNNNSRWLALNDIYLSNYVIANGGKTINSTNIYPNLQLWKKIDKKGKYKDIYNRYAHINTILTEEETNFVLDNPDLITLNINYKDLDKIDVDYLIVKEKLSIPTEYENKIKEQFSYDNIKIYKILK